MLPAESKAQSDLTALPLSDGWFLSAVAPPHSHVALEQNCLAESKPPVLPA
jgi:hypothetical protein